jgi:O-antigen ligase
MVWFFHASLSSNRMNKIHVLKLLFNFILFLLFVFECRPIIHNFDNKYIDMNVLL